MNAAVSTNGTHTLISLADRERWQAALADVPHAFAHTWAHNNAFALSSGLPTYLYVYEADSQKAICPLAERRFGSETDVLTPYGFGGFTATGATCGFAAVWRKFAQGMGWIAAYLQGNPLLSNPLLGAEPGQAQGAVFVIDLRQSEEELLSAMSASRRRHIRHDDHHYDLAGADAGEFLVREAPGFFARRSAAGVYSFAPATWHALMAAPGLLALEARNGGALSAVTLFGVAGEHADFLFNISTGEGQSASAGLLWTGIRRLRALGCTRLNLGGGIRTGDDVAEFKRRFGASEMTFVASRQVLRPDAFERLCREANVSPDTTRGYFPPYHNPARS